MIPDRNAEPVRDSVLTCAAIAAVLLLIAVVAHYVT
jgi:hypothetical protein